MHVPFADATVTFLENLMEAYRQLAIIGPTIIIGDFNAAPTMDDRGGQPTPEDTAVRMTIQHPGLQDLTTSLGGQASHRPRQRGATDSRNNLCYPDSAHVEVTRAQYHDLPSKATGHRQLEVHLKVLQVPPAPSDSIDMDAQPAINPPEERHTLKWVAYYSNVDRILGHQSEPDLNLAMRQAAAACSLHEGGKHEQETTTPHRDLRSMVTAIWCDKRDLHTAIHSHDTHTQQHTHRIAARLETTRRQLREWDEHPARTLRRCNKGTSEIPDRTSH